MKDSFICKFFLLWILTFLRFHDSFYCSQLFPRYGKGVRTCPCALVQTHPIVWKERI